MAMYKVTQTRIPPNPDKGRKDELFQVVLLHVAKDDKGGEVEQKVEMWTNSKIYTQSASIPRFAPVDMEVGSNIRYGRVEAVVTALRARSEKAVA